MSVKQICRLMNVSERLFYMAKQVRERACPELFAAAEAGEMSIHLALQICRADHDGQRLILAEMKGMKPRERTRFVQRVLALAEKDSR